MAGGKVCVITGDRAREDVIFYVSIDPFPLPSLKWDWEKSSILFIETK